jgi:threonyl-tRNA synthetase
LIEHTRAPFPLWLSPEQVAILPISDKYNDYARKMQAELAAENLRAYVDDRSEKVNRKIRDAEVKKTPFMAIVGEKEVETGALSIRRQGEGDLGAMTLAEFAAMLHEQEDRI